MISVEQRSVSYHTMTQESGDDSDLREDELFSPNSAQAPGFDEVPLTPEEGRAASSKLTPVLLAHACVPRVRASRRPLKQG